MEYERLYAEYEAAIKRQKAVISTYLKKKKAADKSANYKEVCRLNGVLYTLYSEKTELEQNAAQLKHYISVCNPS